MKNTCSNDEQWAKCGRQADEYYSVMTTWVQSDRRAGSAERCYGLALDYDKTLDVFIAGVRRSAFTAGGERSIDLAVRYKSILSPDLDYLARNAVSR